MKELVLNIDKGQVKDKDKCTHYWICKTVGDSTMQVCKYCDETKIVKSKFIARMHGRSY
jgi:hypothetical protein